MRILLFLSWLNMCLIIPCLAHAEQATIAVATNFIETAKQLKIQFEQQYNHQITLVSGSTGILTSQILNGAPFDLMLAADQHRPEQLERAGKTIPASRFTYAVGQLVLWSSDPEKIPQDGAAFLSSNSLRTLAIANPSTAPYGRAAMEVLESLDLHDTLQDRLVMGENVGQTFSLVATGNATAGFVARSMLPEQNGSYWRVPSHLHQPVRQDAVLLKRAINNLVAADFMTYLQSDAARQIIQHAGYLPGSVDE